MTAINRGPFARPFAASRVVRLPAPTAAIAGFSRGKRWPHLWRQP